MNIDRLFPVPLAVRLSACLLLIGVTAVQPSRAQDAPSLTLGYVMGRAAITEAAVLENLKAYRPVMEIYVQRVRHGAAQDVSVSQDSYLLGRFNWFKGPRLQDLNGRWEAPQVSAEGVDRKQMDFRTHGFAAMVVPDPTGLDLARYTFTFVRREALGEARCFVIDVTPKKRDNGFVGRIWVEERNYTIVRFNGVNRRMEREIFGKPLSFNVDSWRANVLPGLWLPSYTYVEEATPTGLDAPREYLRSQVRLWGYDPRKDRRSLLATPGAVEQMLDTVLRNLEAANGLALEPRIGVRVLLTAPLDSFVVNDTIVLSRGLIDVLPDEASLALMLAHELAHIVLEHPLSEALPPVIRTQEEEAAADEKAIELLRNSVYKDKLAGTAAFLTTLAGRTDALPNLIESAIAVRLRDSTHVQRLASSMAPATDAAAGSAASPAALPPGARLVLNPWDDRFSLIPTAAQPPMGRALIPLVITPLIPHLEYVTVPPLEYRP